MTACGGAGNTACSSSKTVYITNFVTVSSTKYAVISDAGATGTLADAFGNTVTSGISGQTCTATAFGGGFTSATSPVATVTATYCTTTGFIGISCCFYQSGTYGTSSYVQFIMTGTYSGSSFTASGNSKSLVTSTFDSGTSATPTVSPAAGTIKAGSAAGVINTITVTYTLTNAQTGVPVMFFGLNTTNCGSSAAGACQFVGGNGPSFHPVGNPGRLSYANVTATTTISAGVATATATFTIDPTSPSYVSFKANVLAPITGTPSNKLGLSSATSSFTTIAGAPSTFSVKFFFNTGLTSSTKYTVAGQNVYLDILLYDYWGNAATNPGSQLQITLAVSPSSAGTLSATSVYIATGSSDTGTSPSFGAITFAVASSATGAITVTATGFYCTGGCPGTLTVVSAIPTVSVTTPINSASLTVIGHTIYSGLAGVGYSGTAAASKGYLGGSVTISSVSYTIDGGTAATASGTGTWSFVATLSNGIHTVGVYAKDSNAALSATNSTTILVDTSAPTITNPSATAIALGTPLAFTVVDAQGDLNPSSVSASFNGTGTLTATIASGANNPGASVTYTVNVAGLPISTGHWGVTLTVKDYAGNSATSTAAVVKVTQAFATSVSISGAANSVLGGYTGATASVTNNWSTSQNLIMFAVWTTSSGTVACTATGGVSLAPGASATAFAPCASAPASGQTYTVSIFVITTGNNPVSTKTTITVSL